MNTKVIRFAPFSSTNDKMLWDKECDEIKA